jgi:GNAT superfamily N-acetyltransferase
MASPEQRVTFKVRRLEEWDERNAFRCGDVDLDRFFQRYAGQNQFRHHIGTTYVAVDEGDTIAGFATVTASEIAPEIVGGAKRKRLPNYPLPVLRLARLAVDEHYKGVGVGRLLLQFVFGLARQMADDIGCVGIIVDAKPGAVVFYEKLGFVKIEPVSGLLGDRPEPLPMFLELGQIPVGR